MKLLLAVALLLLNGCGKITGTAGIAFYDWLPGKPLQRIDRELVSTSGGRVYSKAGRVDWLKDEPSVVFELRNATIDSLSGLSVTACYRFEHSFVEQFGNADPIKLGEVLGDAFSGHLKLMAARGLAVDGLQLDLDCPTRLLGAYAKMLAVLRSRLPKATKIGITSLSSWFRAPWRFWGLAKAVDYHVPLFFGDTVPASMGDLAPLSTKSSVYWGLCLARLYPARFFAGLPAYQITVVYDGKGNAVSLESDLAHSDIQACHDLEWTGCVQDGPDGGSRCSYKVRASTRLGGRLLKAGWQLVVQECDAQLLRNLAESAQRGAGSRLAGFIIFRLEKGQSNVLGADAVLAALRPAPSSWDEPIQAELAGLEKTHDGLRFRVALRHAGKNAVRSWPSPCYVEARISGGVFEAAEQGDFARSKFGYGFKDQLSPSSMNRSNLCRLYLPRIQPWSITRSGWIDVSAKKTETPKVFLFGHFPLSTAPLLLQLEDFEAYPFPVPGVRRIQEIH